MCACGSRPLSRRRRPARNPPAAAAAGDARAFRARLYALLSPGRQPGAAAPPFSFRNHRILSANKATREHLGLEPGEIIGEHCPRVVHGIEDDSTYPGCPPKEAVESHAPVEKEYFDEGHGRWLSIAVYPTGAWTADAEEIHFHMIRDITAEKQQDAELAECRRRLAALADEGAAG